MALQMSTRGHYGVRLMVALALNYGRGISLMTDIARQEGISRKYLGQIIIPLKAAGLVASQRGSHGGYALARPPESITVKDVVEAVEGRIAPFAGVDEETNSGRPASAESAGGERATTQVVTKVWMALRDDIERSLSSRTLADLARQAREIGGAAVDYVI